MEFLLGIPVPGVDLTISANMTTLQTRNLTVTMSAAVNAGMTDLFNPKVVNAIATAAPIILEIEAQLGLEGVLDLALAGGRGGSRDVLDTEYTHNQNLACAKPN
jgi:hypothetical protein